MGGHVLVVEDDPFVRVDAAVMLEEAGVSVVEFASADEARDYLEQNAEDVRAVFTDLRLPGVMDGAALASRIVDDWPWIKVVVTSAYASDAPPALPPEVKFMPKPWLPLSVISFVQRSVC